MTVTTEISKANVVNRNRRLYTKEALKNAVSKAKENQLPFLFIKQTDGIIPERKITEIAGVCKNIEFDENKNSIIGTFEIIDSEAGKLAKDLIKFGEPAIVANYLADTKDFDKLGSQGNQTVVKKCDVESFDIIPKIKSSWQDYINDFSVID